MSPGSAGPNSTRDQKPLASLHVDSSSRPWLTTNRGRPAASTAAPRCKVENISTSERRVVLLVKVALSATSHTPLAPRE